MSPSCGGRLPRMDYITGWATLRVCGGQWLNETAGTCRTAVEADGGTGRVRYGLTRLEPIWLLKGPNETFTGHRIKRLDRQRSGLIFLRRGMGGPRRGQQPAGRLLWPAGDTSWNTRHLRDTLRNFRPGITRLTFATRRRSWNSPRNCAPEAIVHAAPA